jgi:hypothetical protein
MHRRHRQPVWWADAGTNCYTDNKCEPGGHRLTLHHAHRHPDGNGKRSNDANAYGVADEHTDRLRNSNAEHDADSHGETDEYADDCADEHTYPQTDAYRHAQSHADARPVTNADGDSLGIQCVAGSGLANAGRAAAADGRLQH